MKVAVLVPWRPSVEDRRQNWDFISFVWARLRPDWRIFSADSETDEFSRTQALLAARARADDDTDVFVVADADCWVGSGHLTRAVDEALAHGWAVPHELVYRVDEWWSRHIRYDWTLGTLNGALAHPEGLPLSRDNDQDSKPYKGNPTGTLAVFTREVFDRIPPDPRFVGWGQEDQAWAMALKCLHGKPWRGSAPLIHLWHPSEPRKSRVVGNDANWALLERYRAARLDPVRMAELVGEYRDAP